MHDLGWEPSEGSPISEIFQIVFIHPEVMADFMQNSGPDLLDELRFVVADRFDRVLKDVNHIRQGAGIFDVANGPGAALVEAQQKAAALDADAAKLGRGRIVPDLNGNLFNEFGELIGQLGKRLFHQPAELRFAHVKRHR